MNSYRKPILNRLMVVSLMAIVGLGLTGCHSSRRGKGSDRPKVETVKVDPHLHGKERKLVEEALSWQGTPYRYGGTDKGKGADCSGVVLSVYDKVTGIKLPRNSAKQAEYCKKIKAKKVKAGDLVFFATGRDPNTISHVGIMIDERQFVHASTKKGVIVSDMDTPYYQRTFKMYGRVPEL
jgi:cell wall-associated NlpC family hydrolase